MKYTLELEVSTEKSYRAGNAPLEKIFKIGDLMIEKAIKGK